VNSPWTEILSKRKVKTVNANKPQLTALLSIVIVGLVGSATAGEVKLSIKPSEGMHFSCTITNSSGQPVFILPAYKLEEFSGQTNCSDCATNWATVAPLLINQSTDFIPIDSNASLTFTAVGSFVRPWRITCIVWTKPAHIHLNNSPPPDPKDKIEIHSAEMPVVKRPPSQ
jgi:hypothetical protein